MTDEMACPACNRRLYGGASCPSCGVNIEAAQGGDALDPLLQEMWLQHVRNQRSMKASLNLIAWIIVIAAALTLLGGYLWYRAVENGSLTGLY